MQDVPVDFSSALTGLIHSRVSISGRVDDSINYSARATYTGGQLANFFTLTDNTSGYEDKVSASPLDISARTDTEINGGVQWNQWADTVSGMDDGALCKVTQIYFELNYTPTGAGGNPWNAYAQQM